MNNWRELIERPGRFGRKGEKKSRRRRSGEQRRQRESVAPQSRKEEEKDLVSRKRKRGIKPFAKIIAGKRRSLKGYNVFMYAQVGQYELALRLIFGASWRDGEESFLVQTEEDLERVKKENLERTLIVIPLANSSEKFNEMVVSALLTKRPVWIIGYPTILRKPLWAHFQGIILFRAPTEELEALREVMGLARSELEALCPEGGEQILGLVALSGHTGERREFCFFDKFEERA